MRKDIIGAFGILAAGAFVLAQFGEPLTAGDYAVVRDGVVMEKRFNYTPPPSDKIKHIDGVPVLRPYVRVLPNIDPMTQVREGPTRAITDTEVTDTWTARAKTAQEISADKDAVILGMGVAVIGSLCHLKNEIRTKVESLPAWSKKQCRAAFKTLLP